MAFHLVVEPGGFCKFNIQPTNSLHSHKTWEICLVTAGQGEYFEGGQVFTLRAGCLFSSPPEIPHEIRSLETRDLELFFVSFYVQRVTGPNETDSDRVVGSFVEGRKVWIEDAQHLLSYGELIAQASPAFLRDELARLFCLQAMETLSSQTPRDFLVDGGEVRRALLYIRSNCLRKLSVDEIADHVHLTTKTLQRRFVTQVGSSVGATIRRQRMEIAMHQLLMGFSVQEVAESCGVGDPSQFSAMFLKEMGVRPKSFQQRYLRQGS
jgi:AraC-like DNA-binding protein